MDGLFKGRHFDQEIIVLCVRWYLRYKLSARCVIEGDFHAPNWLDFQRLHHNRGGLGAVRKVVPQWPAC
jgi:hypothetical protein